MGNIAFRCSFKIVHLIFTLGFTVSISLNIPLIDQAFSSPNVSGNRSDFNMTAAGYETLVRQIMDYAANDSVPKEKRDELVKFTFFVHPRTVNRGEYEKDISVSGNLNIPNTTSMEGTQIRINIEKPDGEMHQTSFDVDVDNRGAYLAEFAETWDYQFAAQEPGEYNVIAQPTSDDVIAQLNESGADFERSDIVSVKGMPLWDRLVDLLASWFGIAVTILAVPTGIYAIVKLRWVRTQRSNLYNKMIEIDANIEKLSGNALTNYLSIASRDAITMLKRHQINEEHFKILSDEIGKYMSR